MMLRLMEEFDGQEAQRQRFSRTVLRRFEASEENMKNNSGHREQ